MKKVVVGIVAVCVGMGVYGCSKKQNEGASLQEPMPIESLSNMTSQPPVAATPAPASVTPEPFQPAIKPESAPASVQSQAVPPAAVESLPPQGPYKPTGLEIQTALKNLGLYTGTIDGKIGPMTRKAVSAFQKANGLTPDGKVGPKTWELLSKHLNPETPEAGKKASKKKKH